MDTLWLPIENKCFMESIFLFTEPAEWQAYDYFSLCLQIFKREKHTKTSLVTSQKKLHHGATYILLRVILLQWTLGMSIEISRKFVLLVMWLEIEGSSKFVQNQVPWDFLRTEVNLITSVSLNPFPFLFRITAFSFITLVFTISISL